MKRAHAYRLMDAAEVVNNLSPMGDILPANEARREMALNLNLHRRHLSVEDRQKLALEMRRNGQSYQEIGDKLGISDVQAINDVKSVTNNLVTYTNLDNVQPKKVHGKDGKLYPAKKTSIHARSQKEASQAQRVMQVDAAPAWGAVIP